VSTGKILKRRFLTLEEAADDAALLTVEMKRDYEAFSRLS